MFTSLKKLPERAAVAAAASMAYAQIALASFGTSPTVSGGQTNIRTTVVNIIKTALSVAALAAVAVIIFAAFRLIIGGSDESQREKARNTVIFAVVGLLLILLAQAIVDFVTQADQGTGLN